MIDKKTANGYYTTKFESIYALGRYVESIKNDPRTLGRESTDGGYKPDFYGRWPMDKAIQCALNGGDWEEGAKKLPTIDVKHERISGQAFDTPQLSADIQGFAPNVPAYLAGTPDSMLNFIDAPDGDKLLRVAVHVGRQAGVTQKQALNRGAAIMAVLDQLSREGYAIELTAIWRNTCTHNNAKVSIETVIKPSNALWAPESVAFALAHVAFQRRLIWRTAESLKHSARISEHAYGHGCDASFSDYDLSYGYMAPESCWDTPKKATDYIKKLTMPQLSKLNGRA